MVKHGGLLGGEFQGLFQVGLGLGVVPLFTQDPAHGVQKTGFFGMVLQGFGRQLLGPGKVFRGGLMFGHQVSQVVAGQGGKQVAGQQAVIEGDGLIKFLLPLIDRCQHQGQDGGSLGVLHLRFQLLQALIRIWHLEVGQGQQSQGGHLPGIKFQGFFQGGDGGLGLLLDQQQFTQHLLQVRIFGAASQGLAYGRQGLFRVLLLQIDTHDEL